MKYFLPCCLLVVATFGVPAFAAETLYIAVPVVQEPEHYRSLSNGVLRAVNLALEEVNGAGALPVRVEGAPFPDSLESATETVRAAGRVVADSSVIAVIGHMSTKGSAAAGRLYAGHGLAMVSIFSTGSELTRQQLAPDWPGARSVFRIIETDEDRMRHLVDFAARKQGFKRIAVLYERDGGDGGPGLYRRMGELLRNRILENGAAVAAFASLRDGDEAAALKRLLAGKSDAVILDASCAAAAQFVSVARGARHGFRGAILLSGRAFHPEIFDAGPAIDGTFVHANFPPPERLPGGTAFIAKFKKRYPDAPLFDSDPFAYEAAYMVLAALAQATPPIRREEVTRNLAALNFSGVLGETRFDKKGDPLRKTSAGMFRVNFRDRKFIPVE